MLKSKWGMIGLATAALAVVLVLPSTSEAQRRGGGGGRGWNGGDRDWDGGRGWGGSGFGVYLGSPYYGGYGYGRGYGNYDGWNSNYYNASPSYDYSSYYYAPTTPTYSATNSYYSAPQQADPNTAMMHMRVPANAELFIDNAPTQQRGTERDFVSPPLEANKTYAYNLRIRYTDANGQVVDRTRKVSVRAGDRLNLDLMNEAAGANTPNEPAIRRENTDITPREQRPAANQVDRPTDNRPADRDRFSDQTRPVNPNGLPNANQGINGQRPQ
jgi:uncharacterized protein (TIGR03000 family)